MCTWFKFIPLVNLQLNDFRSTNHATRNPPDNSGEINDTNWAFLDDLDLLEISKLIPTSSEHQSTQTEALSSAVTYDSSERVTDAASADHGTQCFENGNQPALSKAPEPVTIKILTCAHQDCNQDSCNVTMISCYGERHLQQITSVLPGKQSLVQICRFFKLYYAAVTISICIQMCVHILLCWIYKLLRFLLWATETWAMKIT